MSQQYVGPGEVERGLIRRWQISGGKAEADGFSSAELLGKSDFIFKKVLYWQIS